MTAAKEGAPRAPVAPAAAAPPKKPERGPNPKPTELEGLTRERYRTYALSVIGRRALPDVRDGLKPVQRRILTTMWRQGLRADGRFRKCAKVVGDVMASYHPHGDQAIYEALVRMAQPFASRLPLIEGSGNFGSLDGDPPAAMRYTECRLAPSANDALFDLGADTVPHRPTYDGARSEPVVLPTRLPLLLVNGSTGIAVGVSTAIPPHNPIEVVNALLALLEDPELPDRRLLALVPGPDFPTGGEIVDGEKDLAGIYATGRGAIRVRGAAESVGLRRNIRTLHITSVPWGVDKAALVSRLGEIAADRALPALLDVTDLSTDDVLIRLELRRDADPDRVLAWLYRRTPLESSVSVDLTCLRFADVPGGAPERVGLRVLLLDFLDFRRVVVRRRLEHEAKSLEARLHALEGFALVFDALDRILAIIRSSDGKADAAKAIMAELPLDAAQTEAILELRLYRLARLEIRVVREEMKARRKRLGEVKRRLQSARAIDEVVREELVEIRDRYREREPRRTRFSRAGTRPDFSEVDLIPDEDAVVVLTADGWIRRQREVRDLGRLRLREGDRPLGLVAASTRATVVFFSSLGTSVHAAGRFDSGPRRLRRTGPEALRAARRGADRGADEPRRTSSRGARGARAGWRNARARGDAQRLRAALSPRQPRRAVDAHGSTLRPPQGGRLGPRGRRNYRRRHPDPRDEARAGAALRHRGDQPALGRRVRSPGDRAQPRRRGARFSRGAGPARRARRGDAGGARCARSRGRPTR